MKAPNGCFSTKRTVCGSMAVISLQRSYMPRHRACVSGSIFVVLNTTSSAVNLSPSCQVTSGSRLNVYTRPSGEMVQDFASTGSGFKSKL